MKKSFVIVIVIIVLIIAVVAFLRFGLGGDEDEWICSNGEWVKHGNPSTEKPTMGCGGTNATTNTNQSTTNASDYTNTNATTTAESSETIIANIESVIQAELAGTNNEGLPYFQWMLVDERMTANVEYFVVVRYNADVYGVTGDYKAKMRQEKDAIDQTIATVFKKIMALGYPIGVFQFEVYTSTSSPNAKYQVRMDQAQIAQVDWTSDATALASNILPAVWTVMINGYPLLDANTNT